MSGSPIKFGLSTGWNLSPARSASKYVEGFRVDARVTQRSGPSDELGNWTPGLLQAEVEGRTMNDGTPIIALHVYRESSHKETLLRWNSVDRENDGRLVRAALALTRVYGRRGYGIGEEVTALQEALAAIGVPWSEILDNEGEEADDAAE